VRRVLALLVLAVTAALLVSGAWAGTPSQSGCSLCDQTAAEGGRGSIAVKHGVSDRVPGRGSATQGRRVGDGAEEEQDYSYVTERTAPTCLHNGLWENGSLCSFALHTCPALDQVRFWVWHQTVTVDVRAGEPDVVTKSAWEQERGTYCLGPDDPGVPDIVRTLAAAQAAFEQRIEQLPDPRTRSVPGPSTLVHYPTAFTASNAAPFSFAVTVAGATVRLDVRPLRYDWELGDGSTARTTVPRTSHTYSGTGSMTIGVTITWGGDFTVDGGSEAYPIDPPATTSGAHDQVVVLQARAENLVG